MYILKSSYAILDDKNNWASWTNSPMKFKTIQEVSRHYFLKLERNLDIAWGEKLTPSGKPRKDAKRYCLRLL
jgi:hypothetical protein